jgi:hypothetical protein
MEKLVHIQEYHKMILAKLHIVTIDMVVGVSICGLNYHIVLFFDWFPVGVKLGTLS